MFARSNFSIHVRLLFRLPALKIGQEQRFQDYAHSRHYEPSELFIGESNLERRPRSYYTFIISPRMVTPAMAIRAATLLDKPALLLFSHSFRYLLIKHLLQRSLISLHMGNARGLLIISRDHGCFWTWCELVFETTIFIPT
jgi:hypothetical protein